MRSGNDISMEVEGSLPHKTSLNGGGSKGFKAWNVLAAALWHTT